MGLTQAVRVWTRERAGTDPLGEPTYEWSHTDVGGVLVREAESADLEGEGSAGKLRPDGVRVTYVLAFPRTYDGPQPKHARVTLLDPMYGMDADDTDGWETALVVSGDPRPAARPTPWNMTCEVGRTDG